MFATHYIECLHPLTMTMMMHLLLVSRPCQTTSGRMSAVRLREIESYFGVTTA